MVYKYQPGLGDVGSYQASGKPFISGSCDASAATIRVEFPSVTQWVTLVNHDGGHTLHYAYSANAIAGGYVVGGNVGALLPPPMAGGPTSQITLRVKVCEMFFQTSPSFDVIAGLTDINCQENLPNNWSGSVGVG